MDSAYLNVGIVWTVTNIIFALRKIHPGNILILLWGLYSLNLWFINHGISYRQHLQILLKTNQTLCVFMPKNGLWLVTLLNVSYLIGSIIYCKSSSKSRWLIQYNPFFTTSVSLIFGLGTYMWKYGTEKINNNMCQYMGREDCAQLILLCDKLRGICGHAMDICIRLKKSESRHWFYFPLNRYVFDAQKNITDIIKQDKIFQKVVNEIYQTFLYRDLNKRENPPYMKKFYYNLQLCDTAFATSNNIIISSNLQNKIPSELIYIIQEYLYDYTFFEKQKECDYYDHSNRKFIITNDPISLFRMCQTAFKECEADFISIMHVL